MPSKTPAQARLMRAAAHNPKFAKKVGVPTGVAKEFTEADRGRKFASGGDMKEGSAAYKAKEKRHVQAMKKAGVPKKIVKEEAMEAGVKMARGGGVERKGKTQGKIVKMAKGGRCA